MIICDQMVDEIFVEIPLSPHSNETIRYALLATIIACSINYGTIYGSNIIKSINEKEKKALRVNDMKKS